MSPARRCTWLPEQARGESLDHRADLFSLGSVLYTMCTGRPPFRAANTLAVLRRVSEDTPRPIRETNPEIPDWLADIVAKLMAKEPAERFQSAAEVEEVLGKHLAQLQHARLGAATPSPAPAGDGDAAGIADERDHLSLLRRQLARAGTIGGQPCPLSGVRQAVSCRGGVRGDSGGAARPVALQRAASCATEDPRLGLDRLRRSGWLLSARSFHRGCQAAG